MGEVVRIDRASSRREPRTPTDGELVRAARAGDPSAREVLFKRHYPHVLRLAYRLLGRHDDAQDLAQDVFIQALNGLDRIVDGQAFQSWINRVAVFRARSHIRRYAMLRRLRLVEERPIDPDQVLSQDAPPEVRLELERLYRHLSAMEADVRVALVLHRVEGLTIAETAASMGRSVATVKRKVAKGHAALERLVDHQDRGGER